METMGPVGGVAGARRIRRFRIPVRANSRHERRDERGRDCTGGVSSEHKQRRKILDRLRWKLEREVDAGEPNVASVQPEKQWGLWVRTVAILRV